jgi:RsiW-degrading membrane proteinase PrsW (M82 family)
MGWFVIAVAFALVWVYAFYREDRKNPEPLWLVGLAILGGMIAFPIASRIEAALIRDPSAMTGTLAARAALALFIAGPIEETAKFLAVALVVWFQSAFDEPVDGIVYAAAAASGFAFIENLGFMKDQPASILARGPAATAAHILFACFWGGALGHAKQMKRLSRRAVAIGVGLAMASVCHGLFDLTTWSVNRELSLGQARLVNIGLIVACALFVRWRIRAALRTPSPGAAVPAHEVGLIPTCTVAEPPERS